MAIEGSSLMVSGRLPAICEDCRREVELVSEANAVADDFFRSVDGYVWFRLEVSAADIQQGGELLDLEAPIYARPNLGTTTAPQLVTSTDLELLVEHRGDSLHARAVYPWTANHRQTFELPLGPRPQAFLLTLGGFSPTAGSACCQRLALMPSYESSTATDLTLSWPRLLLPGQGQHETLTALYPDGSQTLLLQDTVVRRKP